MKALATIKHLFFVILLLAGAGMISTACSNKDEAEKVADKIEKGSALTQSDYTCIIDYLGKFAEKAQPIQDQINNLPDGDPSAQPYQEQLSALRKNYPFVNEFSQILDRAKPDEVGADNVKLVDKYTGYEWFTAPAWATQTTDPKAAGIELQAPADSSAVVAGAVDEAKVKF